MLLGTARHGRLDILFLRGLLPSFPFAVLLVPLRDQVEVAVALDALDARLWGVLRVGRQEVGGRIIRRHRRTIGVGRIGEAGARIGVDPPVLDLPIRVLILLRQDFPDLLVGLFAVEAARAADASHEHVGCQR